MSIHGTVCCQFSFLRRSRTLSLHDCAPVRPNKPQWMLAAHGRASSRRPLCRSRVALRALVSWQHAAGTVQVHPAQCCLQIVVAMLLKGAWCLWHQSNESAHSVQLMWPVFVLAADAHCNMPTPPMHCQSPCTLCCCLCPWRAPWRREAWCLCCAPARPATTPPGSR